jgi:4-amino-4-deoxy-L-arabinose transferase-like glycosyltransferase
VDFLRSTIRAIPRAALALALLALVTRVGLIVATNDYAPVHDANAYDAHARSIAAGDGYPPPVLVLDKSTPSAFRPPLYPYLLAATYKLAPGTLTAGRLLGAALGAIAVLLIFLIAERLWGRRVAVAAGAVAAVYPPLIALNGALTVESLFIPLELAVVLAVLAYVRSGGAFRWAIVAGVLCGLATLTRGNGFVLAVPLVLGFLATHGRAGLRASVRASATALAIAALVVAPWTIRNAIVFDGEFIPVANELGYAIGGTYTEAARRAPEKGLWRPPHTIRSNLSIFLNRENDEAEIDGELRDQALEYMWENPGYTLEAFFLSVYRLLNPEEVDEQTEISYEAMSIPDDVRGLVTYSYFLVALLAIAGGVVAARRGRFGPLWLWVAPVLLAFSFAIVAGDPRYRSVIDPFMILLAGVAVAEIVTRVQQASGGSVKNPAPSRRPAGPS